MAKDGKLLEALSMKMTPTEIKNKEFKKSVMGYSPQEVVEFLEAVAKTWEKVQRHEKELLDTIHSLKAQIRGWEEKESDIAKLRDKALEEASQMRREAEEKAEKFFNEVEDQAKVIRERTENWLETVIAKVEETERQKSNFMTAFKSALDSHYALIREEEEQAEPLGEKLAQILKSSTDSASTH